MSFGCKDAKRKNRLAYEESGMRTGASRFSLPVVAYNSIAMTIVSRLYGSGPMTDRSAYWKPMLS